MLIASNGDCNENERIIHKFEGENCIIIDGNIISNYTEKCYHENIYQSTPFIVAVVFCVILCIINPILIILLYKLRKLYISKESLRNRSGMSELARISGK